MNYLLVGWLLNYSNCFSWAGGSPYFKRSFVEFLAEFKKLEYFFLKSMYLLGWGVCRYLQSG